MRKLPVTVLVSVACHGVALAWFAQAPSVEPIATLPPITALVVTAPVEPPPPEPLPVEVTLLADHTLARVRALDATPSPDATRAAITRGTTTTETPRTTDTPPTTTTPPSTTPPATTLRPTLRMRSKVELPEVSRAYLDDYLGRTPPPPDLPGVRTDYEIYKIEAKLHDRHWVDGASPDELTAARFALQGLRAERAAIELVPQKDGTHRSEKDTFVATVARDGTVHFKDKPNLQVESWLPIGISGRFDATDWLMRRQGMDPYASAKREYLDRTRAQRYEIGKYHRREQLAQSATHMQHHLERLWATTSDLAARKQAVFELWDECAEKGSEELLAGSAAARTLLASWVQTKLRGPDAFTTDELARLNAKRSSKAVFAPNQP